GKLEAVGNPANGMMADPQGMAKGYIPESEDILWHTKLLQPKQVDTIEFIAPAPGEYPYLCTFPGHWMLMRGVMTVE
ncbi:MAG: plastocyanin/azurin family copper-binding protein, partial [Verrucomicrobiales bacterium]